MPLVFGFAPVVNTFVTMATSRSLRQRVSRFLPRGAPRRTRSAGVLFFKPGERSAGFTIADQTEAQQFVGVLIPIARTAISWGTYGPMLHRGQLKIAGSRLRPLLCVGLAYFGMAVLVPLAMLGMWVEPRGLVACRVRWSLAGGAAGAIDTLGIILAFNFGGRPIYVMPLVFGCAPIVNTLITIVGHGAWGQVPPGVLSESLLLAIIGAVTVLVFAPKPQHAHPVPAKSDPAVDSKNRKP